MTTATLNPTRTAPDGTITTAPAYSPAPFDDARAEAFMGRIVETLNGAALALMTSIGHRTGLFDTLAVLPPVTSAQLATEAGLDERYVREWLGAMATARVVEHDPEAGTFALPREHAAFLTRGAGADNLAVPAQFIAVLAGVEDGIVDCFRDGGGVPYEAYGRFHEVMAEESGLTVVGALDDHLLPRVPGLTDRLAAGIDVLDVGCGSGRALVHLARAYPNSRFTGYDLSAEAIGRARAVAQDGGLTNLRFEVRDVTALDTPGAFDLVTAFDAIHDQARPDLVLAGIAAALKPDGVFAMQDIRASSHVHGNADHPMGTYLYTISCMHCMTVSLAQGGMGLGAVWGRETAERMLAEAGFGEVVVNELEHDPLNYLYVATRG
jgi:2-polyprenyl-3-methyl-5-hydroxy-6-metoxy-1,4-benzoquinol methylase